MSDYAGVQSAFAAYCHACDSGEVEVLREAFTSDAVWTLSDGTAMNGIDEMIAMVTAAVKTPRLTHHTISNLRLTVDGNQATASSDWTLMGRPAVGEQWAVVSIGTYNDELVKTEGKWLITRRDLDKW